MVISYIALGSNLGDRREYLEKAIFQIQQNPSITLLKTSSFIETDPVGGPPQGKYLNAVIKIETSLKPRKLLHALQEIEQKLGRTRTVESGPRIVDLDILLYADEEINEPDLMIPHPRMFKRSFVMQPLQEIAPYIKNKS